MNDHRDHRLRFAAVAFFLALALGLPASSFASDRISLAFSSPADVAEGRDWSISGELLGAEELSSAQCRYRSDATGGWVSVQMRAKSGDHFIAKIPGSDVVPPSVEFYCTGRDYYGGKFDILASASSPERVKVIDKAAAEARAAEKARALAEQKRAEEEAAQAERQTIENGEDEDSENAVVTDRVMSSEAAADDAFEKDVVEEDVKERPARAAVVETQQIPEIEMETAISPISSDHAIEAHGHMTASVKEMPTEDLAPDGKVLDLETLPPEMELSSSKSVRKQPSTYVVADFSMQDDGGQVSLASRKSETVTLAPAIASSIRSAQMRDMGLLTLPDVLKTVPGLETSRDVQGFHRVAVRGIIDEGSLLVLYDGHRLNNPYDAKPMFGLTTENLEQVEVLRGPGSAVHGTGATLGTINMVSRRKTGIDGAIMGGLEGTASAHVSGGVRFGSSDWYFYGDASYRRSDGYREDIKSDSLSSIMESIGEKREDDVAGITDDHSQTVNAGLEFRRSGSNGALSRAFARFLYEDRGALVGLFDAVGSDSHLTWMAILADITHQQPFDIGTLTARLYFDHQGVNRLFQVAPKNYRIGTEQTVAPNGLFEETKFSTQNMGFDVAMDFKLGSSNVLTFGLTGEMQRLPSYSYTLNYSGDLLHADGAMVSPFATQPLQEYSEIKNRLVGAVVLQDFWQLHRTFSLTAGVRLDVTQLPETVERGGEVIPEGSRFVPSVNPRVGLVWSPVQNWTVKLLYGRAFRAPTMQELSEETPNSGLTQGRSEGNPRLSPSTVDTVEAGIETILPVGMSRLRLRADGFFNYLSNPIMSVDQTGNVIPLENRDLGVRIFGAEGEIRFEVSGSRAYSFINCSWFRAEDLAAYDGFQYLTNVPQIRFNWGTMLPLGPYLNFSLLAQYGAERRNNARSILEAQRSYTIPAYFLVGAQLATQRLADIVEIAITLRNVFDFQTKDEVPRPDSGRMAGLLPREGFGAFATVRLFY